MSEGQEFVIYVLDVRGNAHNIPVNENDSITTLKSKIRQKLNYIKDDQVFEIMYNGEFLDEKDKETSLANKISDYGIDSGTTVNVNIVEERQCQCGCNLKNCNEQRKIDNQIIEENQDEKEDNKEILKTENKTKTNNEEDNENKNDELNPEQNLNVSEIDKKLNDESNLDSISDKKTDFQINNNLRENQTPNKINSNLNLDEDNKDKSNESNQSLDLNTSGLDSKNDDKKDSSLIDSDPQKQIKINNEKNESKSEIIENLSIEKTEKKITNANCPVNLNSNVGSDRKNSDRKNIENSSLISNSEDNNGFKGRKEDDLIDLKSIRSSQDEKKEDAGKNENDSIILIISNYDKEVTRLNVTKNTTMKEIKEQLQQKYSLSDERINELKLWYRSGDIFYDLNERVEQVFCKEDIENREVKAQARGFDFNDVKINWKLILLGLLFFIGAVLAWSLGASWLLIDGLVVVGLVCLGFGFMWSKLKSYIGCIKIGISEDQNNIELSQRENKLVPNRDTVGRDIPSESKVN